MKKGTSTKAKAQKPASVEEWDDEVFCQWADMNLGSLSESMRAHHWKRYVDCWCQEVCFEKRSNIEAFLRDWIQPKATMMRAEAMWTPRLLKYQRIVMEPLSMALAKPSNPWHEMWLGYDEPITQEAIDRRLANWLRAVIISKKTSSLSALAEALERINCRLYEGIFFKEVIDSVNVGNGTIAEGKASMLLAFWEYIEKKKVLPNMLELAELAEINDSTNASKYRKSLGLQGLPKGRPTW